MEKSEEEYALERYLFGQKSTEEYALERYLFGQLLSEIAQMLIYLDLAYFGSSYLKEHGKYAKLMRETSKLAEKMVGKDHNFRELGFYLSELLTPCDMPKGKDVNLIGKFYRERIQAKIKIFNESNR